MNSSYSGNYLRLLTLRLFRGPQTLLAWQISSLFLLLRKACSFPRKQKLSGGPALQSCHSDDADPSFQTRINLLPNGFWFSLPWQGRRGPVLWFVSVLPEHPSIINSGSLVFQYCYQKERACCKLSPPSHRERTLLPIIYNNKPYVLWVRHCAKFWQTWFHDDPARWAFYLYFRRLAGGRLELGELKNLPKARNWGGGEHRLGTQVCPCS